MIWERLKQIIVTNTNRPNPTTLFGRLHQISADINKYNFVEQYMYVWSEAVSELKRIAANSSKPLAIIKSRPLLPRFDDYVDYQYFLVFNNEQASKLLHTASPYYRLAVADFLRDCYQEFLKGTRNVADITQLVPKIDVIGWANSLPPEYRFLMGCLEMVHLLAHTAYILSPSLLTPIPFSLVYEVDRFCNLRSARPVAVSYCSECQRLKFTAEYCLFPTNYIASDELRKLKNELKIAGNFDYLVVRMSRCACYSRTLSYPPKHPFPCACRNCVFSFFYPTVNSVISFDAFAELLYIKLAQGGDVM